MPQPEPLAVYRKLMEEYTAFLEQMVKDEGDKLSALVSGELPRIEQCISVSQANAKQLENYEAKRMDLQAQAGFADKGFRDVVAAFEGGEREEWAQLFRRFESCVDEIRFKNDKSMSVARDNMMALDPAMLAANAPPAEGAGTNPYQKLRKEQDEQTTILEKKI